MNNSQLNPNTPMYPQSGEYLPPSIPSNLQNADNIPNQTTANNNSYDKPKQKVVEAKPCLISKSCLP